MLLQLDSLTKIRQLNRLIGVEFPYLKLEFCTQTAGKLPLIKMPENATLAEVNKKFIPGVINLDAKDTVATVEQRFLTNHKLHAQVLRKAGEVWMRTTKTDGLELEKQNSMGEAASRPQRTNWNTLFL